MIGATDVLMDASNKEKGRREKMQMHLLRTLWLIKDGKRESAARPNQIMLLADSTLEV